MFDVHQDYNIVEFAKENIPGYKVDSGHGYYEISKSAYLLPEAEVKVVDMVSCSLMSSDKFIVSEIIEW